MPARTLLIVGDRFAGFATHDHVVTLSQFLLHLDLNALSLAEAVIAVPGQGISTAEWTDLRSHADRLGLDGYVEFRDPPSQLASSTEAHKKAEANTLIADLDQSGEGMFTAALRLHSDNELLLDHQTGQHVQGMIAIETARQMFLAVSERFFASRHPGMSYYYVIEAMNTDFENFLFPVAATVEFRTIRASVADPRRLQFTAEISVHQSGRRTSRTWVSYSAHESAVIEAKEHNRARLAIERQLSVLAQAPAGI